VSPFDPRSVLLAKHAQHVVLIHFPIALFVVGVGLDLVGQARKNLAITQAASYNLLLAAISTVPVVITGLLAWHFALEGAPLKGTLLWHLVAGLSSTIVIALVARVHLHAQRSGGALPAWRLPLEFVGILLVGLTGHLGGFLSGVNL
jgi:uncharacterized membrane protein